MLTYKSNISSHPMFRCLSSEIPIYGPEDNWETIIHGFLGLLHFLQAKALSNCPWVSNLLFKDAFEVNRLGRKRECLQRAGLPLYCMIKVMFPFGTKIRHLCLQGIIKIIRFFKLRFLELWSTRCLVSTWAPAGCSHGDGKAREIDWNRLLLRIAVPWVIKSFASATNTSFFCQNSWNCGRQNC